MPYAGGLLDQPSIAMRKFEMILHIFNEIQENEYVKAKAESQAKMNGASRGD